MWLSKLQKRDFFLKGLILKYVNTPTIAISIVTITEKVMLTASYYVVESFVINFKEVITRWDLSTNKRWFSNIKKFNSLVSTLFSIELLKWISVNTMSTMPSIMKNILKIESGIPVCWEIEGMRGK